MKGSKSNKLFEDVDDDCLWNSHKAQSQWEMYLPIDSTIIL